MQKKGLFITSAFTAAGFLTALIRAYHNNNFMTDGLPDSGFLTFLLKYAAIAAIAISFVAAYFISAKKMAPDDLAEKLPFRGSLLYLTAQIIAAVLVPIHRYLSYPVFPELFKNHNMLAMITAFCFAIAHIVSAFYIYRGKSSKTAGFISIITPFYFCLQIAEIFFLNMPNPVLLEYTYECIALGGFAMYSIAFAGVQLNKDQTFNIIITGLLVIYCAAASFAGPQFDPRRMCLYIAVLIAVFPNLTAYLKLLTKRVKKAKKSKKA